VIDYDYDAAQPAAGSEGGITFMKTYRILGTSWLIFCGYGFFNDLRELLALSFPSTKGLWPVQCVLVTLCLLDLVGVTASLFLFRGARWARWFIGLFAIFKVICGITYTVMAKSVHTYTVCVIACVCVFATVSVVLLLLPKHEPVA
jgi:hypothetical protein